LRQARTLSEYTKLNGIPVSRRLKQSDFDLRDLPGEMLSAVPSVIWDLLQTELKYEGYVARQIEHNQRIDRKQNEKIPDGFDYGKIAGLKSETRQKLSNLKPTSLGQAANISGVTPSDIAILHIWLHNSDLFNL
jgi:tRNA uridine 5-carboxymethylaminomethyl modification enzyme